MIRCHLSTLMGQRKVNIADVHRATGLNRTVITALYYERAQRLDLDALEKLCRYFGCSIGEFLELGPEARPGDPG